MRTLNEVGEQITTLIRMKKSVVGYSMSLLECQPQPLPCTNFIFNHFVFHELNA